MTSIKRISEIVTENQTVDNISHHPLFDLFLDSLKDINWAEENLLKLLAEMKEAATSPKLKDLFQQHIEDTEVQLSRLEEVFSLINQAPGLKKCEAMAGLIKESKSLIQDTGKDTMVRDVALIFAAQKAEHYEIATYGCLRAVAHVLGLEEVAGLLQISLDEEEATDKKLTKLALNYVNNVASKE